MQEKEGKGKIMTGKCSPMVRSIIYQKKKCTILSVFCYCSHAVGVLTTACKQTEQRKRKKPASWCKIWKFSVLQIQQLKKRKKKKLFGTMWKPALIGLRLYRCSGITFLHTYNVWRPSHMQWNKDILVICLAHHDFRIYTLLCLLLSSAWS